MHKITNFRDKKDLTNYAKTIEWVAKDINEALAAALTLIQNKYQSKEVTKRIANSLQEQFTKQDVITNQWTGAKSKVNHIDIGYNASELSANKYLCIRVFGRDYAMDSELHSTINFGGDNYFKVNNFSALQKQIETHIRHNNRIVLEYKDAVKNYDKYKAQYTKAKEQFFKVLSKINLAFIEERVNTYSSELTEWEKKIESKL